MRAPPLPSPVLRRRHADRVVSIVAVAVLVLAGIALASPLPARGASASFHPASGTTSVTLTATDALSFVPQTIMVPTLAVSIEVENVATTDHTFTLSSRVNQTAPAGTTNSSASGSWFDSAHVLLDSYVKAGKTVFLNVTLPAIGSYQFICRIHFPGMEGSLVVGPATSVGSSSSTIYLYAGAIAAVAVVIALAVLVMRRRGVPPPPA